MAISDELRKQVDLNTECCCEHCLSNKCKEWAFKRKFDFEIIRIKHGKDYGKIFVRIHTIHTNRVNGKEFYPFEEEPEAIFKACEWILKENNGNK